MAVKLKICLHCADYLTAKSALKLFCSRSCRDKYARKLARKVRTCEYCFSPFFQADGRQRFCGKVCFGKNHNLKRRSKRYPGQQADDK